MTSLTSAERERLRLDAIAIFHAAVAAVDPSALVCRYLSEHGTYMQDRGGAVGHGSVLVVGGGKAAARMAAGCERALGAEAVRGEVVVADGCGAELQSIKFTEAGHPLPDGRGEAATRRIIEIIARHAAAHVLCLFGGGASSLFVQPRPPITLTDKIATTRLLLACGADITEVNTVRKHLSTVKGGGLLRYARGPMRALLISDVVGDDPGTIASGPTVPDATTFADAWAVLERYELTHRVPATVARLLRDGMSGQARETVKPGDSETGKCETLIIGSNHAAIEGAAQAARMRGWTVLVERDALTGDTTLAARRFGPRLRQLAREMGTAPLCVLAGGETTVQVKGRGRGGRNQEFALALAGDLAGEPVLLLSAGTDGIDGPTDAAGAFVDGTTMERGRGSARDPEAALADNDSYGFFSKLGDLFCCGPTGTNVMDLKIVLAMPAAGRASGTLPGST